MQQENGLVNAKTASTRDIFIKEHVSKLIKQRSEAISESKKTTYNHCCDYPDEMYLYYMTDILCRIPFTNNFFTGIQTTFSMDYYGSNVLWDVAISGSKMVCHSIYVQLLNLI